MSAVAATSTRARSSGGMEVGACVGCEALAIVHLLNVVFSEMQDEVDAHQGVSGAVRVVMLLKVTKLMTLPEASRLNLNSSASVPSEGVGGVGGADRRWPSLARLSETCL